MKKIISLTILFLAAAAATVSMAQQIPGGGVSVYNMEVEREGDSVRVDYTVAIAKKAVRMDHTLVLAPLIVKGESRWSLPPVVVEGKGSKIARARREWVTKTTSKYENAAQAKNGQTLTLSAKVPYQNWMPGGAVVFESVDGGCCRYNRLDDVLMAYDILSGPVVEPVIEVPLVYEPALKVSFVTPASEPVKVRSESGRAYLQFSVGGSEISPYLGNNAAELQKIYDMVRAVATDPDAKITRVVITGHCSPEGAYNTNMALSHHRAQALRNHIATLYNFDGQIIQSFGAGEDWATLDSLVSRSDITGREHLLAAIRSTGHYDIRERKMMALMGGQPHRRVRNEIYPRLRRTDYVLDYEVLPIGIERGKDVLKTRPGNLSLNEMFLIAETYAPGSAEFNEVFEIAARVYPDSDEANLNAAAIALERRDALSAERYLNKVKTRDAAWWNNMGMLWWLKGDHSTALGCFRRAGETGNILEMEKLIASTAAKTAAEAQNAMTLNQ